MTYYREIIIGQLLARWAPGTVQLNSRYGDHAKAQARVNLFLVQVIPVHCWYIMCRVVTTHLRLRPLVQCQKLVTSQSRLCKSLGDRPSVAPAEIATKICHFTVKYYSLSIAPGVFSQKFNGGKNTSVTLC